MDKKIQEIREWHEREERRIKKYPESKQVRYPNEPSQKAYDITGYLLQQIEIKDKALKWYADWDSNYDPETLDHLGYIPIDKDGGKRARAALKGEDTNE